MLSILIFFLNIYPGCYLKSVRKKRIPHPDCTFKYDFDTEGLPQADSKRRYRCIPDLVFVNAKKGATLFLTLLMN